jgi:hypothetical protein
MRTTVSVENKRRENQVGLRSCLQQNTRQNRNKMRAYKAFANTAILKYPGKTI